MNEARILLVDDEVVLANNMARLLENRGYRVAAVNSGERALDLLAERVFDIVVLDLKMPGMGGLATLREIRRAEYGCSVLILTGHGSVDSACDAMRMGAYDYLTKPYEIGDLVGKIEGAWLCRDDERKRELSERLDRLVRSPEPSDEADDEA